MSPNSNIQLAFLVEMCRDLKIEHDNVSLYDPVFTAEDTALFEDLHMRVLTENRAGPRAFSRVSGVLTPMNVLLLFF